uniref:Uncharacterized protein n=1 Tax=Panagrolaimus sp. ES5 TaxID=591445 RepID=A0AC34G4D9_9BILA
MLSRLKKYSEKKQLIGFISNEDAENFDVNVVDSMTEEKVASIGYTTVNVQTLIDELSAMKNVFKGFIVDLFQLDLHSTPYQFIFGYCKELRKLFHQKEIPSVFITYEGSTFATYLIASKIDFQFDDTILFVITHYSDSQERSKFGVTTAQLKFTPNGYQLIKHQRILSLSIKTKPELLHQQICGDLASNPSPPKYVIIPTIGCNRIPFKKIFKSNNLILLNQPVEIFHKEFIMETYKWLMDKTYIKYHIMPFSVRDLHIYGYYGTEKNIMEILKINTGDPLPISKAVIHTRSLPLYFVRIFLF